MNISQDQNTKTFHFEQPKTLLFAYYITAFNCIVTAGIVVALFVVTSRMNPITL